MTHTTSRTIIALAGLAALVATAYVLFRHPEDTCDSIFENATATFDTKLEFIKAKGELLIGKQRVQDLTERAQLSALNLKTCCIVLKGGKVNATQFLSCKQNIAQQEAHIDRLVSMIRDAQQNSQPDNVHEKAERASQITDEFDAGATTLAQQVAQLQVARRSSTVGAVVSEAAVTKPDDGQNTTVDTVTAPDQRATEVRPSAGVMAVHWNGANTIGIDIVDSAQKYVLGHIYCVGGQICKQDVAAGSYYLKFNAPGFQRLIPVGINAGGTTDLDPSPGVIAVHWGGANTIGIDIVDSAQKFVLGHIYCPGGQICKQDVAAGSYYLKFYAPGFQHLIPVTVAAGSTSEIRR